MRPAHTVSWWQCPQSRVLLGVLMIVGASCSDSGTTSKSSWGTAIPPERLGTTAPAVEVQGSSASEPLLIISTDWAKQRLTPTSVPWTEAKSLSIPKSRSLTFRIAAPAAPITARVKLFDEVNPTTGIPDSAPREDIECPKDPRACTVTKVTGGYEVRVQLPSGASDAQHGVASFRWSWIPKVEPGGGVSRVDNVWSIAGVFRLAK